MFRNQTVLRAVIYFLILEFSISIFGPTVSYALTGGPSAPEFSSFEPVDTTDIVNLATGEFVYNTPILEVPGPEGGYPLSLSYHAGIKLDQEASWVGLGWTLNPGAINRTVSGFPDDNVDAKREVRDYWGGGTQVTETFSMGLSIPGTGVGLNYSTARTTDTYKGFSTGETFSFGGVVPKTGIGWNYSIARTTDNGGSSTKSQAGLSVPLPGRSSLGISISSKGIKTNLSLYGIDVGQKNNVAGRISSFTNETDHWYIPLGKFGSISQKDFYTRYWSDETQALYTYGSLYPGLGNTKIQSDHYAASSSASDFISYAFDSYDIHDQIFAIEGPTSNTTTNNLNDPARQLGGSMPAFDRYDVLGQGIGGIMQPHIFENGDMFGQNIYERGMTGEPAISYPQMEYRSLKKFSNKKVSFRFLNDFSNALTIQASEIESNGEERSVDLHSVESSTEGYNNVGLNQKLAGSRHIEWFTNDEIASGAAKGAGFIDCFVDKADRKLEFDLFENYLQPEAALPYTGLVKYGSGHGSFKADSYDESNPYEDLLHPQFRSLKPRKVDLKKKIGGFMVTNESGVTYHYALPVYNYNEYTRSKLKKPRKGVPTFREYKNDDPYAYTWLLTGMTGPDYVDRNDNNILDDEDWGYWVKFDYGRWADAYQWRTPHTGYTNDVESEYATFSYGIKELYYLDAVETRSHKAIFVKSKRKDGRGVTSRLEGGSNPRRFSMEYRDLGTLTYNVSPVSTMKLDAIYLFNKEDLASLPVSKERGEKYNEATSTNPHAYPYKGLPYQYSRPYTDPGASVTIADNQDFIYVKYHNGYLVYDDDDIHDLPDFRSKALRVIEFETDYSLSRGVPNSIGSLQDVGTIECIQYGTGSCDELDERIGSDYEWPSAFGAGCTSGSEGNSPVCCLHNQAFYSKDGVLDRYRYCEAAESDYAGNSVGYARTGKLTLKSLKFLGKGGADLLPPTSFNYGYNPDYFVNKFDQWGYYKSDYPEQGEWIPPGEGEFGGSYGPVDSNTTREITDASSANSDAWSLAEIITPLGASVRVEYEPNKYQRSVYNDFSVMGIEKLEPGPNANEVNITFRDKGVNLTKIFSAWSATTNPLTVKAFIVQASSNYTINDATYLGDPTDQIVNVGTKVITVNSAGLRNAITPKVINGSTTTQHFVAGFAKIHEPADRQDVPHPKYAGGVRVKSVAIADDHIGTTSTVYDYNDPITHVTSGVTSFKPYNMPSIQFPVDVDFFDRILQDDDKKLKRRTLELLLVRFQSHISEPFSNVLSFANEAPAPGTIYEYVTIKNFVNDLESEAYTVNHFRVFEEDMITRVASTSLDGQLEKRTVTIENNAAGVGELITANTYSRDDSPIKSVSYNYLMDDTAEEFEQDILGTKQGIVEQSFHKSVVMKEYRIDWNRDNWWERTFGGGEDSEVDVIYNKEKALVTKRHIATDVLTSVTETDHLTGLVSNTQYHSFDLFSGQPTSVRTSDSYGNGYLAKVVPAYRNYPKLGLKIYDISNKHMLTQPSEDYILMVDGNNAHTGLVSASIQTWSEDVPIAGMSEPPGEGIWRKKASYQWNSQLPLNADGTFSITEFDQHAFNWTLDDQGDYWEKTYENTLYDNYSHELEAKDINGSFASSLRNANSSYVIATAANASYNEIAYSGAESLVKNSEKEGNVHRGDGTPASGSVHSGFYSLLVGTGKMGYNFILEQDKADLSRKYRASVWVHAPGNAETQSELNLIQLYYTVNGKEVASVHPVHQKQKSKSWYLLNLDVIPDGNHDVVIGVRNNSQRGVYFDDFRVHPLDASLTSYVYDKSTQELNFILDGNNFYTRFEYDAAGRLIRTSREAFNFDYGDGKETLRADQILQESKYNYQLNAPTPE